MDRCSVVHNAFKSGMAAVLGMVCAAGCATSRTPEPPPVVEQVPPEPKLAAAGDAQVTLFGELPDHQRVPFHAAAAPSMKQHTFETEGADFDVDVSADGKSLAFASTRHNPQPNIYLKTVDGRAVTQLTDDPAADVQPAFSPDGQTIAFASNRSGNWDIWLMTLQGGRASQITHSPQHEVHPSFSPDGKQLAYCQFNERADSWELWVLSLAHPDSRKMIGLGLFPEWSPKSDSIVYQKARERGGRWFSIWRIDLDAGEPRFPVELAASSQMALIQPSWSTDGRAITYGTAQIATDANASEAGNTLMSRGDVWMIQADGSSPVQLTDGTGVAFGSVWGADGRIYFTGRQNGSENIWSVQPLPASGGPLANVPAAPVAPISAPAVAPAAAAPNGAEPVQANRGG